MKKALLFGLTILLAAGMIIEADAAMHGKDKGKAMGKGPDRASAGYDMDEGCPMMMKLSSLGLDDKQKEAAKAIHYKMKKESIRKQADREIAEIELREILSAEPVDLKSIEAKLKQIESLRTEMHLAHIKAREEIKSMLTPEQKKKFRSLMGPMVMGPMQGDCCMTGGMGMKHGHGMGHGMMGDGMGMGRGMMSCRYCMTEGTEQREEATASGSDRKDSAPPSAAHQH